MPTPAPGVLRILFLTLALALAGCGTTTSVVRLDPKAQYAPSESVQILLKAPEKPYVEIAKLESRGVIGETEPSVLEDARERARVLGADALIVLDVDRNYQPPVVTYDPWPPFLPWYYDRWHGRYWPYPSPFLYGWDTHTFPGGTVYTVRSLAIRYR
jgi:hypothetical protein